MCMYILVQWKKAGGLNQLFDARHTAIGRYKETIASFEPISKIDNVIAVSYTIKLICMRLKNWDKGEFHRAFRQFCTEYTLIVYFKTLHYYCIYPAEKSH
jgi:hypothetical protein